MGDTNFYDHFHRDKPTGIGAWLSVAFFRNIMAFAEIGSGQKVLEIGPGRGVLADLCLERSIEYTAIEPNPTLAESLESRGAEVIRAIVPPLPDLSEKFDFVVMVNVLEHMDGTQEALAISNQIRQCLKPGGRFIACTPDYMNMGKHFFNVDFSHGYVTTQRRLSQLLLSAGYVVTKSRYLAGPLRGLLGFLVSAVAAWLPFGAFHTWFPKCRVCMKLYKIQLTFSRKIAIAGENPQ